MNKWAWCGGILICSSLSYASARCYQNISARYLELNQRKTAQYSYCVNPDIESLTSSLCVKNKKCEATQARNFTSSMKAGFGAYGNPAVSTCEVAGGRAKVIEFTAGPHKNQKITICEFSDKSYMNLTGWMMNYVHYGVTK